MKDFTMFLLCEDPDGYFIYYNYKNKKLYGCYSAVSQGNSNYYLLLILPFINAAINILSKWIMNWNVWAMRLICILAILATIICINVIYDKKYNSLTEHRKRMYNELPEPSQNEWQYYLQKAKNEKIYNHIYICLLLGIIVSIGLFLWNGFALFLFIFSLLYWLFCPINIVMKPIRKYKFIKSKIAPNP